VLRTEIIAALSGFPEAHVLLDCARQSGTPFALRGGIVRHLIAVALKKSPTPAHFRPSLFDLVDAFSDIDVVVEQMVHWSRLAALIANALPLASYFRWEVSTSAQVIRQADTYESIALDRFLLQFHPDGRSITVDPVSGGGNEAYNALIKNTITASVPGHWQGKRPEEPVLRVAAALKLIRYKHQFGFDVPDPTEWVANLTNISFDAAALQRIEFHILDILFSAKDRSAALGQIQAVLEHVSGQTIERPGILKQVDALQKGVNPSQQAIRAIVYPWSTSQPARADLQFVTHALPAGTLIPWSDLSTGSIATTGTTECCDFSAGGPIVVAYRPPGEFHAKVEKLTLDDMGIQARTDVRTESATGFPEDLEGLQFRFAVPALHSIGVGGAMRIDPRYLRTVLGDGKKLQVSLQEIPKPELPQ
jgi:hypothetical protein